MTQTGAERSPAVRAVDRLIGVLDLDDTAARTTEDIFTGRSQRMPFRRVFGGQVLAQSLVAATRTVPDGRRPHSMHGYFLRPGDDTLDVTFAVDRIHDGRSFSRRRTQAFQHGVPIFSMIASFQVGDEGLEHAVPMPDVPEPDDVVDSVPDLPEDHPLFRHVMADRPAELRHIDSPLYLRVEGEPRPAQAVWMRTRARLPDHAALHRAVLAYLSDMTLQEPILRAHGIPWATPGLKVASLDHAMWWHRDGRPDEWMLYVQESPSAGGGRGLSTGRIFDRAGRLLVSVAQEVMVRVA
ncbi:acyl-CoA thioesterase [Microbacterium sp.]|uniref:acyl-CoA thioesterase n=1 Tax=Microbacterium sp. TaxID=51671 RepID=UPI0039E2B9F2